jgi:hypothetical protein
VLFGTAFTVPTGHADVMRVLPFIGDALGAALVALAVPVAILAVGAPIVLVVSLVLSVLGLR